MELNVRGRQVLADAPHIYTCVITRHGPHVTPELTGAVIDAIAGRLGRPLPPHRIVVGIEPLTTAVLVDSGVVADDPWDEPAAALPAEAVADGEEAALPDHPLVQPGPTVLGWQTTSGHPLALPATWDPESSTATVDAALFARTGAAAVGAGCVTFDTWMGYGPTGKQGVMLRGAGAAAQAEGAGVVTVTLHLERVTTWDGVQTDTVTVD